MSLRGSRLPYAISDLRDEIESLCGGAQVEIRVNAETYSAMVREMANHGLIKANGGMPVNFCHEGVLIAPARTANA